MTEQTELPPLRQPDTASLSYSGRSVEWISGYERGFEAAADQMQEYARLAIKGERERCARLVESLAVASSFKLREQLASAIRKGPQP
jgi:hypothetical protein